MSGEIEFGLLVLLAAWSAVTTYGWLWAILVDIFVFNFFFLWRYASPSPPRTRGL